MNRPLATLTLKAFQLEGKHGYYDSERRNGNRFELDVIIRGNFIKAAEEDNLDLTVNYELIEEEAHRIMNGPSQKLIETLCFKIGEAVFNRLPEIEHLELALRKIDPPVRTKTAYAEIRLQWHR